MAFDDPSLKWRHRKPVNAASDLLAAILGRLGFVGRTRRRAHIREDLGLLDQIGDSPAFGRESSAYRNLVDYIALELAKHAGVELTRSRKSDWGAVFAGLVISALLAYWTYKLNEDGFQLVSLLPGVFSGLMLIGAVGSLFESTPPDDSATPQPTADTSHDLYEKEEPAVSPVAFPGEVELTGDDEEASPEKPEPESPA